MLIWSPHDNPFILHPRRGPHSDLWLRPPKDIYHEAIHPNIARRLSSHRNVQYVMNRAVLHNEVIVFPSPEGKHERWRE